MIVFKTFLKVLKSCLVPIIMYTVFLIAFGGINLQTSDNSTNFVATKPDIYIVNNDEEVGLTKHLIDYLKSNNNFIDIKEDESALKDALFYRDVNYIIYIPESFHQDFIQGKNPSIEVKSTNDYAASLVEMQLTKYLDTANAYLSISPTEQELITNIDKVLTTTTHVELTTQLDSTSLQKASFYYNFANYSLLAGCVYVICLILSSFKSTKITKRTIISSMDYKKYNRQLLLSNGLFTFILWLFYVLLSFILLGDIMFTSHGLLYIINSFVFTFCALTIAFLIGNLVSNKEAINGIVNVVALGSSFLCGAFVPMQWLPDFVLKIAHILPSYYYISNNEAIKSLEVIDQTTLQPFIENIIIIVVFSTLFIFITNFISKKKRVVN